MLSVIQKIVSRKRKLLPLAEAQILASFFDLVDDVLNSIVVIFKRSSIPLSLQMLHIIGIKRKFKRFLSFG
jgi:hypothetical protein